MSPSLVGRLGAVLNKPPLSAEILPGDGSAWLNGDNPSQEGFVYVENHLGIPQKTLYKSYLEAAMVFNRHRGVLRQAEPIASHTEDLIHSSAVLLLANPAHQTAWNMRKQLILLGRIDSGVELGFCAALLTIRDGAKQSLLWHHRRWLLRRTYTNPKETTNPGPTPSTSTSQYDDEDTLRHLDIPVSALRNELELCALACNTYERNYFAWTHRSRCLDALFALLAAEESVHSSRGAELGQVFEDESSWCNSWIEQHASDYSSMQYRCRFADAALQLARLHSLPSLVASLGFSNASGKLWEHARALVQSYPDHEALWLYLRGALLLQSEDQRTTCRIEAKSFTRQLVETESEGNVDAPSIIHWNASRFLAWLDRQA